MDSFLEDERPKVNSMATKSLKSQNINGPLYENLDKMKSRRASPGPTPVQSNPIFRSQSKPMENFPKHLRQRRGSFLYKQDSSSNIGDVISPKLASTKNDTIAPSEDLIITPFAQILVKLR